MLAVAETAQAQVDPSSSVPLQLLAQVLGYVPPKQRVLSCALVCKTWRMAVAMLMHTISTEVSDHRKASSLASWLQQHSHTAAVHSIKVCGPPGPRSPPQLQLQLPAQQLTTLQSLDLSRLDVTFTSSAGHQQHTSAAAAAAVPPPELSALTHLALQQCTLQLNALPTFTRLWHLAISLIARPDDISSSNIQVLHGGLPCLQLLTHLQLGGQYTQDAALAGLQHLPHLQQLLLTACVCTARGLASLPVSLSSLQLHMQPVFKLRDILPCFDQVPPSLHLSPHDTPSLLKLTALQCLSVSNVVHLHVALLAQLPSLQHLEAAFVRLEGEPGRHLLADMRNLTRLQHLAMHGVRSGPYAAALLQLDPSPLTVSSQLTYLQLANGLFHPDRYVELFAAGTQLTSLCQMHATMGLLASPQAVEGLVACCPHLEELQLCWAHWERGPAGDMQHHPYHDSTAQLTGLTALTSLKLGLSGQEDLGALFWQLLGQLTSLRCIEFGWVRWSSVGDVLHLTACRALQQLQGTVGQQQLEVVSQAPAHSPPNVWSQLPSVVLHMMMRKYDRSWGLAATFREPPTVSVYDEGSETDLLRAAAAAIAQVMSVREVQHLPLEQVDQDMAELHDRITQVLDQSGQLHWDHVSLEEGITISEVMARLKIILAGPGGDGLRGGAAGADWLCDLELLQE